MKQQSMMLGGGGKQQKLVPQFKPQGPQPLRKLPGVKSYPQGQVPPDPFLPLEKVIGLSSKGNSSIAVNPVSGDLAYPAGAIICIYNPKENKQTKFLYSVTNQRSYSCLAFSSDGKYLAAGEGAFRQPEITIWEIDQSGEYIESKHLRGHKYGIESVMFSPNLLYLISLGDSNDRGLFVWDWRTEQRVTSNKLGKPVNTFAYAKSSTFFVTAGFQHLKYWYFDDDGRVQKNSAQGAAAAESIMESKSADLTKVKLKIFVGVQCVNNGGVSGKDEQVLSLASDGHLYVYDKNRKLTKWMNIKVERALGCALGGDLLYCACTEGIVRIFNSKSLEHILTLPKPPPLGQANVESGKKIRIPPNKDSRFADAIAVLVDEQNQRVIVLYSDKMLFMWDVRAMDKILVYRTLYSHCGPIYDMQYLPNDIPVGFQHQIGATDQVLGEEDLNAITKFVTCSGDRTVRFWNFTDPSHGLSNQTLSKVLVKNAYCKEMSRMIYVSLETRDNNQNAAQNPPFQQFKARPITLKEDGSPQPDDQLTQQRDLEQLRCLRISPDGKHLACGDWSGNIRIHDLQNNQSGVYEEIQCIQAHDSEVVCLDYSPSSQEDQSFRFWLASGSRDRLTQIYEYSLIENQYQNVAIIDDHSSTITSVKFTEEKSTSGAKKRLKLITSGADKQIVIRNVIPGIYIGQSDSSIFFDSQSSELQTVLLKKEQCKQKVFSMDALGGYGVTGHDKYLSLWQITTSGANILEKIWERKAESQKKPAVLDHLRVILGPQNQSGCEILISSCADKTVTIYETVSGNAVCRTTCGEVTTAMCLSTNMKHLITTSMDGIIYFWKLPENLTKALIKLKSEKASKVVKPDEIPDLHQQIENQQKEQDFDFGADQNDQDQSSLDISHMSQPPPSISMIMQQINKVAGQIQQIQPLRQRQPQSPSREENTPFDPQSDLQQINTNGGQQQKSRRNAWGAPAKTSPRQANEEQESSEQNTSESQTLKITPVVRPLQLKENKLPRWAQSMAGESVIRGGEHQKEAEPAIEEQFEDENEEIFSNTLEKLRNSSNNVEIPTNNQGGVKQAVFYGITTENAPKDQQEIPDDEELKQLDQADEDPDELIVRQQLQQKSHQHKQMLGLDDEDEEEEQQQTPQQQKPFLSRSNRLSENRQSQSKLFFQRKQNQRQAINLLMDTIPPNSEEEQKQEQTKIEDIFSDVEISAVDQNTSQQIPEEVSQEVVSIMGRPFASETAQTEKYQEPIKALNAKNQDNKLMSPQHKLIIQEDEQQNSLSAAVEIGQKKRTNLSVFPDDEVQLLKPRDDTNEQPLRQNTLNETLTQELTVINESLERIAHSIQSVSLDDSNATTMLLSDSVQNQLQKSFQLWNSLSQALQPIDSKTSFQAHNVTAQSQQLSSFSQCKSV